MAAAVPAVFLVVIGAKLHYRVHSVHTDVGKAQAWRDCLDYGGEDVHLVVIPSDKVSEIINLVGSNATA